MLTLLLTIIHGQLHQSILIQEIKSSSKRLPLFELLQNSEMKPELDFLLVHLQDTLLCFAIRGSLPLIVLAYAGTRFRDAQASIQIKPMPFCRSLPNDCSLAASMSVLQFELKSGK